MSKIYRANMTAQDVLDAFSSDKAYAARAKELKAILSAIDSRVGIVETQSKADKLLAEAESLKAQTEAESQAVSKERRELTEERRKFEQYAAEEHEILKSDLKKSTAAKAAATRRESRVNEQLAEREKVLGKREEACGDAGAALKASWEECARKEAAIGKFLTDCAKALKDLK